MSTLPGNWGNVFPKWGVKTDLNWEFKISAFNKLSVITLSLLWRAEIPFLFYKIINGLAQVPFEGVLVEAYKGTRRKHNMKLRQIGHTTSQYGQSFFPKTISAWNGLLSLKLRHWLNLDQIFLTNSMHPFRIIPEKGPAEYRNRPKVSCFWDFTYHMSRMGYCSLILSHSVECHSHKPFPHHVVHVLLLPFVQCLSY